MNILIYVVSWCLLKTVPTSCPNFKPDEFGNYPKTSCLVYHTKTDTVCYTKSFTNKDSACSFYERALEEDNIINVIITNN